MKDGKDLADNGSFPSIYVGESGRSLHERAKNHWDDFASRKEDSHILKHWVNHHSSQGQPSFKITVVKYCKDALSRQVGEAVRIGFRGQTLNSKGGYNRSAINRLILEEKSEDHEDGNLTAKNSTGMEDCQDPNGLSRLKWKTGNKRKDGDMPEADQKQRKRRKLQYPTLPENWGYELEGKARKMDEEENTRKSFLMDGYDSKVGIKTRQQTIKNWSAAELFCRKLSLSIIKSSSTIGEFMSGLEEQLMLAMLHRSVQDNINVETQDSTSSASNSDILYGVTKGQSNESPSNNPEKDNSWGQDENPKLKTLNVEDENTAGKRKVKEKTVKEMFHTQKQKADIANTERLEKESRLDRQRRQEIRWKGKRDHHCRLRWTREWLDDTAIPLVVNHGSWLVDQRVRLVLDDILELIPDKADKKSTEKLGKFRKLIVKKELEEIEQLEPSLGPHGWIKNSLKRKRLAEENFEERKAATEDSYPMNESMEGRGEPGEERRARAPGGTQDDLDTTENLETTPKLEKVKTIVPAGRTTKPKIWTKLKSGLYGWKNLPKQRATSTSASIKTNTEAANNLKVISANTGFSKWLLTAGSGGVGLGGERLRLSENILHTKLHENIQTTENVGKFTPSVANPGANDLK